MIKKMRLFTWILVFCTLVIFALPLDTDLRLVKYALPILFLPLLILIIVNWNKLKEEVKYIRKYLIFYSVIIFLNFILMALFGTIDGNFFRYSMFILTPIITTLAVMSVYKKNQRESAIKISFWIVTAVYLFTTSLSVSMLSFSFWKNAFATSMVSSESGLAFVFGIFFLYFFIKKDKKFSILSAVMVLLSFKRIVILGCFLGVIFYLFSNSKLWNYKIKKYAVYIFILINLIFIVMTFLLANGSFEKFISSNFGMSSNQLTLGRQEIYKPIIDKFGIISLLGTGVGSTDEFLVKNTLNVSNIHSDLLRVYYEFGIIIFIIWLYFIYTMSYVSNKILAITIYMNILFITDNVFIVFSFLFFMYLIQAIYYEEHMQEKKKEKISKLITRKKFKKSKRHISNVEV